MESFYLDIPRSGEFYTYGDFDFRLNDKSTLNILIAGFEKFDKNQNMILALLFYLAVDSAIFGNYQNKLFSK